MCYLIELINNDTQVVWNRNQGPISVNSAVFSGDAGGARAPLEFGGSEKGRSLISAFWSLAITTNTAC